VTFEEADCLNGCPAPGFVIPPSPFVPDNLVQMEANTLYFIQLDLLSTPDANNTPNTGLIDPIFTSSIPGGQFIFSPGVFPAVSQTPIPAALPLFATGLGALGLFGWRTKQRAAALA
jgi:hypothetical protein